MFQKTPLLAVWPASAGFLHFRPYKIRMIKKVAVSSRQGIPVSVHNIHRKIKRSAESGTWRGCAGSTRTNVGTGDGFSGRAIREWATIRSLKMPARKGRGQSSPSPVGSASIASSQSPHRRFVSGLAQAFAAQLGQVYFVLLAAFFFAVFRAASSPHSST